jgi:hypothetical protein
MEQSNQENGGVCGLCDKEGVLQDSHLLPKWAYKRVRNADDKGADPINIADGSAHQTSKQITQHLLCAECEGRFSRREDYVARITGWSEGKPSTIYQVPRQDTPHHKLVKLVGELDPERLAYFAASVIWRSHAMNRGNHLGAYAQSFVDFLLERAPFPPHAALSLGILEPADLTQLPQSWVTEPSSTRADAVRVHGFMVCGLIFRCFVGKALTPEMRKVCIGGPNQPKYAIAQPAEQYADFMGAATMAANAVPRGKLARI